MRLLLANANTTERVTALCAAAARAAASPGTEIVPATPRFGPAIIASRAENAVAAHALLECLAEAHAGCDAAILAVSFDTALAAARQLLPIPVIGMTEAACLAACMLGGRFGIVTFSSADLYREVIAGHGLAGRLSGIALVEANAYDAAADPAAVAAKVAAAARSLAQEGADSVLLGGAALAGIGARVQAEVPVPLVDGIAAAVAFAEGLVRLRLPKPRTGGFAAPAGRASQGLSPMLSGLLAGR